MALSKSLDSLSLYDEGYLMVASIDFGTTFSGYAFSLKSSKNDIKMNKNWGEDVGFLSYKTPTSVLLDKNGRFLAFGFEAETKYNEMVVNKGEDSCELYRHFKMTLHSQKNLSRKSLVQSVRGTTAKAMDIFTHAVKYLKNHMVEAIMKTVKSPPTNNQIRWVLTVPAIWSEQSKHFMREVVYRAKLTQDIGSRQFMISLEPEAASIFCRQLDTDQFGSGQEESKLLRKQGAKYIIVDAGGGTIDTTAHEIQADGNIKELVAASGGPWGGTKVDENFINLMIRVLGRKFVVRFQRECPAEWFDLRLSFEKMKKSVRPDDEESTIRIPMNWMMSKKYKEITGNDIEPVLEATQVQGVKFNKNGWIVLENSVVEGLFQPVLHKITSHVKQMLQIQQLRGVSMILLVGGFGECAFLHNALKRAFSPRVTVLCPSDAGIAIVKGAVNFGHAPLVITSRIARKTYGESLMDEFDSSCHSENRKVILCGKEYCEIMNTFVRKGEEVAVGEVRKFQSHPLSDTYTYVSSDFYSADVESVTYPDDPTVEKIGSFITEMPDEGPNRELETTVYFGATEILVESREVTNGIEGEIASTTIDFLAD